MPKYKEVAEKIRERIKSKEYAVDERIPDQHSLAEEFGTSRVTIKRALDLLTTAGLVYTIQGSGTYVKRNALLQAQSSIQIGHNVGLTTAIQDEVELESKVIRFDVRFPDETEQQQLMINKETPIYHYQRLRILGGRPYSLENTVVPVNTIPGITEEVLKDSVYRYIREELSIVFGDNRQIVRAAKPTATDKKYLDCKDDDPVLEVEKIMFLKSGVPFEYSTVHHRFDMVEMSFINQDN
ncbi:GntR family transcriptional regulator [Marinilactibacillus piezotolerans]|uniref:GntR family transcriptional regulator n=1 Tax=Marinilactibacillus piezotolerans TaxID=258723 RepID=UPI0009AFDA5E|nr:GntR family transcriptional regulator [Marinilactibacillus piezotolerans]